MEKQGLQNILPTLTQGNQTGIFRRKTYDFPTQN